MIASQLSLPRATLRPALRWRLRRRHLLMLALAAEVLAVGAYGAEHYRPPGITVDVPSTREHVIT